MRQLYKVIKTSREKPTLPQAHGAYYSGRSDRSDPMRSPLVQSETGSRTAPSVAKSKISSPLGTVTREKEGAKVEAFEMGPLRDVERQ